MKKAVVYPRVSTKAQREDGSSLDSQIEACLNLAQQQGYDVPSELILTEDWPGHVLERPALSRLRQMVKSHAVDAVICYSTDRLTRNPVHLLLLAEECEKAAVRLIFVTEPMDNSPEGQLLGFVKGYFAQLEREKIKDRMSRGRRARARSGKLPSGAGIQLYGYNYIRGKGTGQGIRVADPEKAEVVRMMFHWVADEGLSETKVVERLNALSIAAPKGGSWGLSTVSRILKNEAYIGKTVVYKYLSVEPKQPKGGEHYRRRKTTALALRPREEWIEIPNATEPLIDQALFEKAQHQLESHRANVSRIGKYSYLLTGHLRCGLCGKAFHGHRNGRDNGRYVYLEYRCGGSVKALNPVPCRNRRIRASWAEDWVWRQVTQVLMNPGHIFAELERRRAENEDHSGLQEEDAFLRHMIGNIEKQRSRILRIFQLGEADEEWLAEQLGQLKVRREQLTSQLEDLVERRKSLAQVSEQMDNIEAYCRKVTENLGTFALHDKRLALDALRVEVLVYVDRLVVKGVVPIGDGIDVGLLSQPSR